MSTQTNIFGAASPTPTATRLGTSVITLPSVGAELVVMGAGFDYKRDAAVFSPLNLNRRILTTGEPQGTLELSLLVGPFGNMKAFLQAFADSCNLQGSNNNITIAPVVECGTASKPSIRWIFKGLLLVSISARIDRNTQTGNMILPQAGFLFTDFEMHDS